MKINVSSIVRDHWATLYNAKSGKHSAVDVVVFYIVPIVVGGFSYWRGLGLSRDAYNVSITFFGIFIALMLNIQVAIFSIFQRKWPLSADKRVAEVQERQVQERRTLLKELNANISYIVLVCCAALFAVLVFYVRDWKEGIWPALTIVLYSHFMLTLLMIVKRAHALFQKEYRDSPA